MQASRTAADQAGNPFTNGFLVPGASAPQHAANNISNAINLQSQEDQPPVQANATAAAANTNPASGGDYPEVGSFLDSIALGKYTDRFVENGIEDEETILELNDEHLDALTVPLGHKLKILKRIKMLRQEKGMSVPESR